MRKSAGLLLFRRKAGSIEVFLVHPGGPFWKGKDIGAWSIPKGEFDEKKEPLTAAIREFREETGQEVNGEFLKLQPVKQKAGKMVYAWAVEGDVDETKIVSNTVKVEYPYKSGKWMSVPEVDEAAWFSPEEAAEKINPAQSQFIIELLARLHEKTI